MWQNILVIAILAMAGAFTLWRFYRSLVGKASCCSGGCSCKGTCASAAQGCGELNLAGGSAKGEKKLLPLSGAGCGCTHGSAV